MPLNENDKSRSRDLEIQLFEKIDERLDQLSGDMRDVRERVIRIEAQDVNAKILESNNKIKGLDERLNTLEKWQARVLGQVALIVVPASAAVGAIIKFVIDVVAKH